MESQTVALEVIRPGAVPAEAHVMLTSWAVMLFLALGIAAGIVILALLWRAGKGKGVKVLAIVTVTVAIFLFLAMFVTFPSRVEPGQRHEVPFWTIGLRIVGLVLFGMVVGSTLILMLRFFEWLGKADPAGAAVNPEERKRILGMVEQGKMTGVEGAELLDALGKSSALRGQQTFGRLDVAILVAIAVVVLGFFLPWQYINMNGMEVYQSGHQIGTQGWAVLISAILSTLVVFITPKEYLYKLVLLQVLSICVGLALVVGVWWNAGEYVGAGTVICCLGFAFALIGSGMKLMALGR